MNLPDSLVASGKAAVQAQWSDKASVTRKGPIVNNKETILTPYTNIACHFSQASQPILDQSSTVAITKSVFTLFVDTSVQLITGDTLNITHKGQTFIGVAGEPFNRTFSNGVKVEVTKVS